MQYAVSGFWTAVAYQVPVTFLVLRNNEYGILKWFAEVEQVSGAPGLDLPALETAEIARGYGVDVRRGARPRRAARGAGRRRGQQRPVARRGRRRPGHVALLDERRRTTSPLRAGRRPAARRAGRRHARAAALPADRRCSAPIACLHRALDLVRYASDASPYRLIPQVVVMAHDAVDVAKVFGFARREGTARHAALGRHQPQRPGPDGRDPRRRAPPLRGRPGPRRRRRAGAREAGHRRSAASTAGWPSTSAASARTRRRPTSRRSAA